MLHRTGDPMTKINALTLFAITLTFAGCFPMPVTTAATQDEAQATECPCPDFALNHHPEDPDSPGECMARSRTGQTMDAEEHPACQRAGEED